MIAAIRDLTATPAGHSRVLIGIGDDAAAWQPSRSHRSVITTDQLVEGVHFRRETMSLHDAGWRSMASNLSDAAAMGARPVLATVAIGFPPEVSADDLLALYRGIAEVAKRYDCAIAGGDLTRAPVVTVCIAVIGEVRQSNLKTRAGARPGDVLAVTGPLGASRAGLHLADNFTVLTEELREEALRVHRTPEPRVAEGRWLSASEHVHAMMDLSDGLSTDLRRLCAASNCKAIIDEVPVAPSARAMAHVRGEDPNAYALAGGEDFELLVAVRARAFRYLSDRFKKRFGHPLLRIGTIEAGSGVFTRGASGEEAVSATGWDHLREQRGIAR